MKVDGLGAQGDGSCTDRTPTNGVQRNLDFEGNDLVN